MTEILKHFVFITPPSEDFSLIEEKREVEAETELSTTPGSSKVNGETYPPDLGETSHGPSMWPKIEPGVDVKLTGVFASTRLGFHPSLPKLHLPWV